MKSEPHRAPSGRLWFWALPVLYMAAIFVLSSASWGVSIPSSFPFRDKGVHFLEYLLLGLLSAHAARNTWPSRPPFRAYLIGALVASIWGLGDEMHQAFVPGRSADVYDFIADVLGAGVGAALRAGAERLWPARFSPPSARAQGTS